MPKRIKPTDVTAAFRAAVQAARLAHVDVDDWNLKMEGSRFSIVTRDEDGGQHIVPGTGQYMGGYFAASFREAFDALHAMRLAWSLVPHAGGAGLWRCYHVDANNGMTYGAAATSVVGAKSMVVARMKADGDRNPKVHRVRDVGEWSTQYGITICYGETKHFGEG